MQLAIVMAEEGQKQLEKLREFEHEIRYIFSLVEISKSWATAKFYFLTCSCLYLPYSF